MSMSLGYGSKRYMPEARHAIYASDEGYGPPNYEQAVSSSGGTDTDSITTPRTADRPWSPTSPGFSASTAPTSQEHSRNNSGSTRRPLPHPQTQPLTVPRRNFERYVYRYRLAVGGSPVEFLISVEPESGRPIAGKYTFRLSFKANGVERPICEPVERTLTVGAQPHLALDPRHLEFIVFVFPGKTSLPAGCLWSVRVWLRVNGADHRLFGDDELWIGKDPDFNSIGDASFGRLKVQDETQQVYNAFVGRALVTFTFRWEKVTGNLYRYWLDYDAGGVGTNLFEDFRLKIDGDPRNVSFLVFTVPANSVPSGASHKLRVWLRSPTPLIRDPSANYALPFNDSYVYQRIWKTDDFKLGAQLNFDALGPKMLMAFTTGGPETVAMPSAPPKRQHGGRTNSLTFIKPMKGEDYGYANF